MEEPLVIQTLKQKRAEISGAIAAYQSRIAQARHDLAHINASIRLFESGERNRAQYIVSHGFFQKGEIADICGRHLRADGELDTRQLAERVMCERNLDATDTVVRNSVVFKVVQALRHAARRKIVTMVEKRKGICVWAPVEGRSLPIAFPDAARGKGQPVPDQSIGEPAIALETMVFEPGGMRRVIAETFGCHAVMLAADHPAQA